MNALRLLIFSLLFILTVRRRQHQDRFSCVLCPFPESEDYLVTRPNDEKLQTLVLFRRNSKQIATEECNEAYLFVTVMLK